MWAPPPAHVMTSTLLGKPAGKGGSGLTLTLKGRTHDDSPTMNRDVDNLCQQNLLKC